MSRNLGLLIRLIQKNAMLEYLKIIENEFSTLSIIEK